LPRGVRLSSWMSDTSSVVFSDSVIAR